MSEPLARRSFLATAAATVAGAAIGSSALARRAQAEAPTARADETASVPSAIRLGVASYSLRKLPLDKALDAIKALRTPYVNFKSMHVPYEKTPAELAAMRAQIEAAGFQIVGGGTIDFGKDAKNEVQTFFDYARAAGMPTMVSTCDPSILPRIETFAKQYDIKVAIHNHGPEDKVFHSPYDVLAAVKNMDKRMGLCIDIGHTARAGTDVVKAIADAGPRLLDMHVKDLKNLKERDSQCIVGEGLLPFPEIFRTLDAIHYGGFVNLEYEIDADDPLPGMKQSFAYMRGVIAGLGGAPSRTAGTGQ